MTRLVETRQRADEERRLFHRVLRVFLRVRVSEVIQIRNADLFLVQIVFEILGNRIKEGGGTFLLTCSFHR